VGGELPKELHLAQSGDRVEQREPAPRVAERQRGDHLPPSAVVLRPRNGRQPVLHGLVKDEETLESGQQFLDKLVSMNYIFK
jgi:hypothetical protein